MRIVKLAIKDISDYSKHPFLVTNDDDMIQLIDSIKNNGLYVPVIVRPKNNARSFEMLSGHRRKYAFEILNIPYIDAIIRNLDDSEAVILVVSSNFHRTNTLPSEKAKAYKMLLEAMNCQGKRNDLTLSQGETKYVVRKRSDATLAERFGVNRMTLHRYAHLANLIPELLEMVDNKQSKINQRHKMDYFEMSVLPAESLSFLLESEQRIVLEIIKYLGKTPNLSQAQTIKKLSQRGKFDKEIVFELIKKSKANEIDKLKIPISIISRYFPKEYTQQQMVKEIIHLLEVRKKEELKNKRRIT